MKNESVLFGYFFAALALTGATALAQDPYSKPEHSWVSLTGTVVDPNLNESRSIMVKDPSASIWPVGIGSAMRRPG